MPKLGFGADKTTYDNIDWDGFGVGSNVATVDVKDGRILRVRRFDYGETYDLEELNRYRLEKDGVWDNVYRPKWSVQGAALYQYARMHASGLGVDLFVTPFCDEIARYLNK